MTADDLIDALGGNLAVAEIAGVGSSAVSNWRRAGRLPPRLYLRLAAAGRERGVEVPEGLFKETPDPRRGAATVNPEAAA
jgi:hypothetical protein